MIGTVLPILRERCDFTWGCRREGSSMTRKFDRDCFHCFEEQICRSTTFGGKARWEVQSLGLQNHSSKARMYSKAIQSRCSCSSIYIINCTVHHSLACCLAGTEFGLDLIAHSCCLTTEVSWWRNVKKLQTSVIVTWALAEICRMPIFCPVTSDIQYHSTYISTPFFFWILYPGQGQSLR